MTTLGVNPDGSQLLFDQGKDLGVVSTVNGSLVGRMTREIADPEIRIDLHLNDDQIDIAMRAADVSIWTREPERSDLIRRSPKETPGAAA